MTELVLPSKVMDKKLIQTPEGNVVDSDEEWDSCGKWMLHHPRADLEFLDSAWTALQQLLADGTLVLLKASTGLVAKDGASIYCFTRQGKQEARRAADAISELVDFDGIMYYKPNRQTPQGIGNKNASIYMRTFRGGFYTRRNGSWIQDNEDSAESIDPFTNKFYKENYSGNESLPSTCTRNYCWNFPENHQYKESRFPRWFMYCSSEDEGPYLSEVDRVWLVAKQLTEEGFFVGITLRKLEDAKCAEVRFYISQDRDVYSRLAACDRIFEEASIRSVMYFVEILSHLNLGIHKSFSYKYTSDGELYRKTKFAEEYIFK